VLLSYLKEPNRFWIGCIKWWIWECFKISILFLPSVAFIRFKSCILFVILQLLFYLYANLLNYVNKEKAFILSYCGIDTCAYLVATFPGFSYRLLLHFVYVLLRQTCSLIVTGKGSVLIDVLGREKVWFSCWFWVTERRFQSTFPLIDLRARIRIRDQSYEYALARIAKHLLDIRYVSTPIKSKLRRVNFIIYFPSFQDISVRIFSVTSPFAFQCSNCNKDINTDRLIVTTTVVIDVFLCKLIEI